MASHHPDRRTRRVRISLLVSLLVAAAGSVAWFLAAPLRATPARTVPEADIDKAAPRPARMPDGPRVAAAASAASGPREDPASCGEDQLPKNGELGLDAEGHVAPTQSRLAGVGFTGAQHRLDASLRASADPFSRSLADWLNLGGVFASPEARSQALVQDALATDDPRTYGLAYRICLQTAAPDGSCARLNTRDWAQRDPGNALPWLYELDRAEHAGDVAAQSAAMDHLADATRFDVHEFAAAAVVARVPLTNPADLAAQHLAATLAYNALPMPEYGSLLKHCPDGVASDPQRRGVCERIAHAMYEKSDAFVSRAIGGAIHKHLTGDASWLERARQDLRFSMAHVSDGMDASACASERYTLARMIQFDTVDQVTRTLQARKADAAASAASR